MSLNIRHLTNKKKTKYVVFHSDTGEREIYDAIDKIPESIRHYAKDEKADFIGPDVARVLGVQDIFYPEFLNAKCMLGGYEGNRCITEACKFYGDEYDHCRYLISARKTV